MWASLARAQATGEVATTATPEAQARMLLLLFQGSALVSRAYPDSGPLPGRGLASDSENVPGKGGVVEPQVLVRAAREYPALGRAVQANRVDAGVSVVLAGGRAGPAALG